MLGLSVEENVRPKVAALRSLLGLSEAEVRKLVLALPQVLGYAAARRESPTVASLRQLFDLDEEEVRAAVLYRPALLGFSLERRVQPRVERTLAAASTRAACSARSPTLPPSSTRGWNASSSRRPRAARSRPRGARRPRAQLGAAAGDAPSLSVVVPAFNEAERLPPVLRDSLRYLRDERRRAGS